MRMPCAPRAWFEGTLPALARDESRAGKRGSIWTEPVKCSAGALLGRCEPLRAISIEWESWADAVFEASACAAPICDTAELSRESEMSVVVTTFILLFPSPCYWRRTHKSFSSYPGFL